MSEPLPPQQKMQFSTVFVHQQQKRIMKMMTYHPQIFAFGTQLVVRVVPSTGTPSVSHPARHDSIQNTKHVSPETPYQKASIPSTCEHAAVFACVEHWRLS